MFLIQREQYIFLERCEIDQFAARITELLSEHLRGTGYMFDAVSSDDERKTFVQEQVHAAQAFGFSTEIQIASYVLIAALLGPKFHEEFDSMKNAFTSKMDPEHLWWTMMSIAKRVTNKKI